MKITYFLFCISIVLLDLPAIGQKFNGASIEHLKQTVVPIVCVGTRPANQSIYLISVEGTGFFFGDDGDIVTAGHVAKSIFSTGRIPVCAIQAVYVPVVGWNSSTPDLALRVIAIRKCWWNDDLDVGVCALAENPFIISDIKTKPFKASFGTDVQSDGTPIAFTGFPLSFLQPITSQGTVGTYRGIVGDTLGPRDIFIDKNAWPGASGSPVYTSDGKIVGLVVQRGFSDASGLAIARSSSYITNFLSENKVERDKEEQNQKH